MKIEKATELRQRLGAALATLGPMDHQPNVRSCLRQIAGVTEELIDALAGKRDLRLRAAHNRAEALEAKIAEFFAEAEAWRDINGWPELAEAAALLRSILDREGAPVCGPPIFEVKVDVDMVIGSRPPVYRVRTWIGGRRNAITTQRGVPLREALREAFRHLGGEFMLEIFNEWEDSGELKKIEAAAEGAEL